MENNLQLKKVWLLDPRIEFIGKNRSKI